MEADHATTIHAIVFVAMTAAQGGDRAPSA
jgi:hypothetical protein